MGIVAARLWLACFALLARSLGVGMAAGHGGGEDVQRVSRKRVSAAPRRRRAAPRGLQWLEERRAPEPDIEVVWLDSLDDWPDDDWRNEGGTYSDWGGDAWGRGDGSRHLEMWERSNWGGGVRDAVGELVDVGFGPYPPPPHLWETADDVPLALECEWAGLGADVEGDPRIIGIWRYFNGGPSASFEVGVAKSGGLCLEDSSDGKGAECAGMLQIREGWLQADLSHSTGRSCFSLRIMLINASTIALQFKDAYEQYWGGNSFAQKSSRSTCSSMVCPVGYILKLEPRRFDCADMECDPWRDRDTCCEQDDAIPLPTQCGEDGLLVLDGRRYVVAGAHFRHDCVVWGQPGSVLVADRPLRVSGAHLELSGALRIQGRGAGICLMLSFSEVSITGTVSFMNCRRGAVSVGSTSSLLLSGNISFRSCGRMAGRGSLGGAIEVGRAAKLNITGKCIFVDCDSSRGGAILVVNATVGITGYALFRNCRSSTSGGAIYARDSTLEMRGARLRFSKCMAEDSGGAIAGIATDMSFSGPFSKVVFEGCSAACDRSGAGGIVYVDAGSTLEMNMLRFRWSGCSSAIQASSAKLLEVWNAKFEGQGADGIAIIADAAKQLVIVQVNASLGSSFLSAVGIYSIQIREVYVTGCVGTENVDACINIMVLDEFGDKINFPLDTLEGAPPENDLGFISMTPGEEQQELDEDGNAASKMLRLRLRTFKDPSTIIMGESWSQSPVLQVTCGPGMWPRSSRRKQVNLRRITVHNPLDDCSWRYVFGCCARLTSGLQKSSRATASVRRGVVNYSETCDGSETPCTCLEYADLAPCRTCVERFAEFTQDMDCVPCPEAHLSLKSATLTVRPWYFGDKRDTCKLCDGLRREVGGTLLNCSGDTVWAAPGTMLVASSTLRDIRLPHPDVDVHVRAFWCPNVAACTGTGALSANIDGIVHLEEKNCGMAYDERSPGCSRCAAGYGRVIIDPFRCVKCASGRHYVLLLSLFVMKPVILFAFALRSSLKSKRERHTIIFKIISSFSSVSMIVHSAAKTFQANSNAAEWLRLLLFGNTHGAGSAGTDIVGSYDCLLGTSSVGPWIWLLMDACIPGLLLGGSLVIALALYGSNAGITMLRPAMVLGSIFLPNIAGGFMRNLASLRLQQGYTIIYYSSYNLYEEFFPFQAYLTALSGLGLCLLLGPIYWNCLRRRDMPTGQRQEILSFLVAGFKEEFEWWETLVHLRKVCLHSIAAAMPISYSPGAHVVLALAVVGIALVLQAAANPYKDDDMNLVEMSTLSASAISLVLVSYCLASSWTNEVWQTTAVLVSALLLIAVTFVILIGILFGVTPWARYHGKCRLWTARFVRCFVRILCAPVTRRQMSKDILASQDAGVGGASGGSQLHLSQGRGDLGGHFEMRTWSMPSRTPPQLLVL